MKRTKKLITVLFILLSAIWQVGCSSSSGQPPQPALKTAIQDVINGLNKIEIDVNKGDFQSAAQVYDEIHAEFHSMILDPVTAKLGTDYGDNIHGKMGILENKIINRQKGVVNKAIQLNRDSMYTIAKDMGVPIAK